MYRRFPAFKYRNYRLYFTGQLISFTGSWLHGVAHGWLVYELTRSPFWLGAISAVSALPVLLLSLFGGVLVDRYDRRRLLFLTQSASLVLALVLGLLVLSHLISLPILIALTFLSGVANAIDNPVTQAFVVDLVGKEDLPSAVGLNSAMFNTGKVLGPAVAGFLIAWVGIGNIFLINALSFLAILVSLYFIKIPASSGSRPQSQPLLAIKEGVNYAFFHPLLNTLLLTAAMGAVFYFSQATIMPVIAEKVFHQGSAGLGVLLASSGFGALVGSLIISSLSKKASSSTFILAGNFLFIVSTFLFTYATMLPLASILLFVSGMGLTVLFSTLYATVQKHVHEDYRGRVSSLYVLLFIGLSPLGNLLIGSTSSWFGPQLAIRISLIVVAAYSLFLFRRFSSQQLFSRL